MASRNGSREADDDAGRGSRETGRRAGPRACGPDHGVEPDRGAAREACGPDPGDRPGRREAAAAVPEARRPPEDRLVRLHDLAGRPRGTGFAADHHGTVVTSHEAVDGLTRLVLRTADDRRRVVTAAEVTPLPALGLALVRADGLSLTPLPITVRDRAEPGAYVRIAAGGWREARLLGTADVTYTATDRFHQLGALELAVGTSGLDALRLGGGAAGGPVLDAATGAVLGVLGTALSSGHRDAGFAVPLRPARGPLTGLLAANAATVPAYGPDLNLAGVLQLTATSVGQDGPATGAHAHPGPVEPVERSAHAREFAAFTDGTAPVLGLVGAPGTGRTTELAALAARRSRGAEPAPTLWLRGADLRDDDTSVADAAARALARAARIVAASDRARPGGLGDVSPDRLARLARDGGRPLLLLLDGPEEMPSLLAHRLPEWTEGTAAWLRATGARLVVACRAEYWEHAGAEFPRELLHAPATGGPAPLPEAGADPADGHAWPEEQAGEAPGPVDGEDRPACAEGREGTEGPGERTPAREGGPCGGATGSDGPEAPGAPDTAAEEPADGLVPGLVRRDPWAEEDLGGHAHGTPCALAAGQGAGDARPWAAAVRDPWAEEEPDRAHPGDGDANPEDGDASLAAENGSRAAGAERGDTAGTPRDRIGGTCAVPPPPADAGPDRGRTPERDRSQDRAGTSGRGGTREGLSDRAGGRAGASGWGGARDGFSDGAGGRAGASGWAGVEDVPWRGRTAAAPGPSAGPSAPAWSGAGPSAPAPAWSGAGPSAPAPAWSGAGPSAPAPAWSGAEPGSGALPPCVRIGDLGEDEARQARARHRVPDGALSDADGRHPLTLRLLSEVLAALPGPAPTAPVDRDTVFAAWLDLACLRVATRIAAQNGQRGTAVRRLAARVAGQVHEAARRSLGPGQGELDREAFEAVFPWGPAPARLGGGTGWASAVLAEGVLVPAGGGYRFAHEELADWLQGTHLDLDEALRVLVHDRRTPPDARTLPVPHHRIGPVAEALLLRGRQHGVPQLALTLEELVHALDAEPHSWWAARLLARTLVRLPDATPYTEVLRLLADGIAERGGAGRAVPGPFGPGFWTALRLPQSTRLDLLRRLVLADGPPHAPGPRHLDTVARLLAHAPAVVQPLLVRWFDDTRPLPATPHATVATAAQALLHTHRHRRLDGLVEVLADSPHPRADELLAVLAEEEPAALCRAVDRWARGTRPDRHAAALVHGLRAAPHARTAGDRALLRHAALLLLAHPAGGPLHGGALALLIQDPGSRDRHLPRALGRFATGDPHLPPRAVAAALATHPEPVLDAFRSRLRGPGAAEALCHLLDATTPALARRVARTVAEAAAEWPGTALTVAGHVDRGLGRGPAARAVLLPLVTGLLDGGPGPVRSALAAVLAADGRAAPGFLRRELREHLLAHENDPAVLEALLHAAVRGDGPDLRALVHRTGMLLVRTPEGAARFDRALVDLARRRPAFGTRLTGWLGEAPEDWAVLVGPSTRRTLEHLEGSRVPV
ncbi:trypsin-like peptidase domain-containing protein [Streptomyces sp. TP-A0875]|uniref:trypsin-like peptidase domain-containing protein n=1 Tax=Streptomyces sp. TP-A0875 TaxID=552354 RepID=UPI000ACBF55A|nr:trypsin-like peptidase domain-containing protein [Streptomyces sp. TP-A0875]